MPDEILEKLEKIGSDWEEHKKAADKYHQEVEALGKASGETKAELKKINESMDANKDAIEEIKKAREEEKDLKDRLDKIEVMLKRNGSTGDVVDADPLRPDSEIAKAYKAEWLERFCKGGLEEGIQVEALDKLWKENVDAEPLYKNLAVNLDPSHGYHVPPDMSGQISTVMYETSPIRQVASVQQISTDALEGPIDEDRATFEWVGETESRDQTDLPNRGMWRIPTHEAAARVLISSKLLQDSVVNQEAWAIAKISEEFALGENEAFIVGDGVAKPKGLFTYPVGTPTNGKQPRGTFKRVYTGVNGDLTNPDVIINAIYSQKKAYRGNSKFAYAREGIEKVRLLRMDDKYVWQPGLQANEPDRLAGYETLEFDDIPDFATDADIGAFGDFAKTYQIVDRIQMQILRDPYTQKPFVEFYVTRRVGGAATNFDAMTLIRAGVSP